MIGCIRCHGPVDHRGKCQMCDREPIIAEKRESSPIVGRSLEEIENSIHRKIAKVVRGYDDFDNLLVWVLGSSWPPMEQRKLHGSKKGEDMWHRIPDYLHDLNACVEFEQWLRGTDEQIRNDVHCFRRWRAYQTHMMQAWDGSAPAQARCLIFLRVMELWDTTEQADYAAATIMRDYGAAVRSGKLPKVY